MGTDIQKHRGRGVEEIAEIPPPGALKHPSPVMRDVLKITCTKTGCMRELADRGLTGLNGRLWKRPVDNRSRPQRRVLNVSWKSGR